MKWGEFKKLVDEHEDVGDDTELWYIDVSLMLVEVGDDDAIEIKVDDKLGLSIH